MSKITMDAPSKAELANRIEKLESEVKRLNRFMINDDDGPCSIVPTDNELEYTIKVDFSEAFKAIKEVNQAYEDYLNEKYGKREEMGNIVMVNDWYAGDKIKHEIRYARYFGKDENGNAKLKIHFYDDTSVVVKIDEVNNKPTAPEGESVLSKEMDLEQRQHRLDRLTKQYGGGD